jgi:chromosome segregation ATPase
MSDATNNSHSGNESHDEKAAEIDVVADKDTFVNSKGYQQVSSSIGQGDHVVEKHTDEADDDTVIVKSDAAESNAEKKNERVTGGPEREESDPKTNDASRPQATKRNWALRWSQMKEHRYIPRISSISHKKTEVEKNEDAANDMMDADNNDSEVIVKHDVKEHVKHHQEKEKKKKKDKNSDQSKEKGDVKVSDIERSHDKELLERLDKVERELQMKENDLRTLQRTNQELSQRVANLQQEVDTLRRERDLLQQQQQQQQQQQGNSSNFEALQKEIDTLRKTLQHEVQARCMLQEDYERQLLEKHTVDYSHVNRLLMLQLVLWGLVLATFAYSLVS